MVVLVQLWPSCGAVLVNVPRPIREQGPIM